MRQSYNDEIGCDTAAWKEEGPCYKISNEHLNMQNRKSIINTPCEPIGNRRSDSRIDCVKWTTGYDRVGNRALRRKYASGRKVKNPTMIKICSWSIRGLNNQKNN